MGATILAASSWLGAGLAVWSPPELGGQPVPDEDSGSEIDWLLNAPWAKVALLITLAVGVLVLTNMYMRGRKQGGGGLRVKPDFDLRVAKLENLPPSTIAAAAAGPIHLEGVLRPGEGALGTGAHACVYHNRYGKGRKTAIAAELALLDDGTGLVGLEQLEQARVIAPREDDGPHDTISLYLGDRVQVLGDLLLLDSAQAVAEGELRGMLGSLGQIQIRVLERPKPEPEAQANDSTPADDDAAPELDAAVGEHPDTPSPSSPSDHESAP